MNKLEQIKEKYEQIKSDLTIAKEDVRRGVEELKENYDIKTFKQAEIEVKKVRETIVDFEEKKQTLLKQAEEKINEYDES